MTTFCKCKDPCDSKDVHFLGHRTEILAGPTGTDYFTIGLNWKEHNLVYGICDDHRICGSKYTIEEGVTALKKKEKEMVTQDKHTFGDLVITAVIFYMLGMLFGVLITQFAWGG